VPGTQSERSLTSLIQPLYHKNVIRLTTQGCNNIVISTSWLYRTIWNNLTTSLITSIRLLQLLTACSILVDNLGQAVRTQVVDGLLADLLQDVRFLRVYINAGCLEGKYFKMYNSYSAIVHNYMLSYIYTVPHWFYNIGTYTFLLNSLYRSTQLKGPITWRVFSPGWVSARLTELK
jgi:hypothetical protein